MDAYVFKPGNLRGFVSPARGLTTMRKGMTFIIRQRYDGLENGFRAFVSTRGIFPILLNLRIIIPALASSE
jgi:hypothetical protein